MTRKQLESYRANKRIIKRNREKIDDENFRDIPVVAGKVKGSSNNFPYIPRRFGVQMNDPVEVDKSRKRIARWQQEISRPGASYIREELAQIEKDYRKDQEMQYAKRQAERFGRLEKYSLDEDNQKRYGRKANQWKKSFIDSDKAGLKEAVPDDIMDLKKKISEANIQIDSLKKQFSDITDGYSYDDWFSEFSSIEDGFGDAPDGDTSFDKLKELEQKIKSATSEKTELLHQRERRKQIDTGYKGRIPDDKMEEYNAKALEYIKLDTGYSDEKAEEFHIALKEYFGGDYEKILTGDTKAARIICDGLDRMPIYDGSAYRGLCFSKDSGGDITQFTGLKVGDKVPSKGIISS